MTSRARLGSVALRAGLLGSLIVGSLTVGVAVVAPASADVAVCESAGTGGDSGFYSGPSASAVYDATFAKGSAIPGLPEYTPQDITTWPNWDGKGHALLILGAYRPGEKSRLYGIDPRSGKTVGVVKIAEAHMGGVAVVGKWLIVQGSETSNTPEKVRHYKLSTLRSKLKAKGTPGLKATGDTQTMFSADFMSSFGGRIWTGRFGRVPADSKMYQYKVTAKGKLKRTGGSYQIPLKTQGVMVTAERFVFQTSAVLGQADLWVVERGPHDIAQAKGRCFRNPSMAEGLTLYDGKVYAVYESGADQYRERAVNPITRLHKAEWSDLKRLRNP